MDFVLHVYPLILLFTVNILCSMFDLRPGYSIYLMNLYAAIFLLYQ